jgi:hypothetical protein
MKNTPARPEGRRAEAHNQQPQNKTPLAPVKSWRDVLAIHPAAELFPRMTPDELKALGEDIKKHGGLPAVPPVLWEAEKGAPLLLLDGRNRLDAMEAVGLPVLDKEGKWLSSSLDFRCTRIRGEDPYAIVISANFHRRHLTAEQRQHLLITLIARAPEKSDRQIAKEIGVDHKTIASARAKGEDVGRIPHVETHTDSKGRKQPSSKPSRAGKRNKPKPKPRDDIDATSAGEIARKDAEIDELRNAKRQLEIKVAGLESEIEELRGKLATGTGGDMFSEFQIAIKKWEETDETQRGIIARLENENAKLRAGVAASPADDGLNIPEYLKRSAS